MGIRLLAFVLVVLGLPAPVQAADAPTPQRGLRPMQLKLPGQAPQTLYTASHALVIGAADYTRGWPSLPGVRDDVGEVSRALESQGFQVTQLMNPTGEQLERTLKRFVGQHGQARDHRLLVYYAGHGHTLKPAEDRQLGYLVPVDAPLSDRDLGGFVETAVSMETIEALSRQIQSKHALFVFDSCFSGTFFKMRAAPELIALKTTQPVRQFITSGSADQQVPDASVFRRQFIEGIQGGADLNGDGYVTGSELGSFLEDKVTNYSRRTQTPQYGKIRDPALDKGDFVFQVAAGPETGKAATRPAAPDAPALDLADLQKEDAVRAEWALWQKRMESDYARVEALAASPAIRIRAWERFLESYPQDNPFSDADERLRAAAARQKALAAEPAVARGDLDADYGSAVGRFRFGMSASAVNDALDKPFRFDWLTLPVAGEYRTETIRYLWQPIGDISRLPYHQATDNCGRTSYFVFFFDDNRRLFRMSLRLSNECPDRDAFVRDLMDRYGLKTRQPGIHRVEASRIVLVVSATGGANHHLVDWYLRGTPLSTWDNN